jgi:hypothetical protein
MSHHMSLLTELSLKDCRRTINMSPRRGERASLQVTPNSYEITSAAALTPSLASSASHLQQDISQSVHHVN